MSVGQRHRTRVFVVAQAQYAGEVGNLVFKLNLKYLFSSSQSQPLEEPQPDESKSCPTILSLPDPVACFKQVDRFERMSFASSASGNVIVAASSAGSGYGGRTLIYDEASVSPGPNMRSAKLRLFLVPVGDHMFFAISGCPSCDVPKGLPRFETLQQLRPGRWAWTAVKDPPGIARGERGDVMAYFVSGACVWVSLLRQGTYSFDTARRRWRKEGAWELPVRGRAVLVPNFLGTGRRLLFGIRSYERSYFCAVDMDARPPVVIGTWPEAWPTHAWAAGYTHPPFPPQLNYFGGGRFCMSVTYQTDGPEPVPPSVVSFIAFELTPELQLIVRQSSSYLMPTSSRGEMAVVIN